jgi:hypothetical protein
MTKDAAGTIGGTFFLIRGILLFTVVSSCASYAKGVRHKIGWGDVADYLQICLACAASRTCARMR